MTEYPNRNLQPRRHYFALKLDQIVVVDWYPTLVPTGRPEQVHLMIDVALPADKDSPALPLTFVTRFKSPAALDRFIESLLLHRESVWGKWQRDPTIREDLEGWKGGDK